MILRPAGYEGLWGGKCLGIRALRVLVRPMVAVGGGSCSCQMTLRRWRADPAHVGSAALQVRKLACLCFLLPAGTISLKIIPYIELLNNKNYAGAGWSL